MIAFDTCWTDATIAAIEMPAPSASRAPRAVFAARCMSPAAPVTDARACCMSDCSREIFAAMSMISVAICVMSCLVLYRCLLRRCRHRDRIERSNG
jgi:hypothetical protein